MARLWRAVAIATASLGVLAPVAAAHQGNPNYRSTVREITPAVQGVDAHVVNWDDSVELRNRSGRTVLVKGYRGEPYVRIAADGTVAVNHRSPSYYLNDDRYAQGVDVPPSATPTATPDWHEVDGTGRYTWHDHRIHWMAHTLPPQVKDSGRKTKVFNWKVPITVAGRPAAIHGTLTWVGRQGGGFPVVAGIALGATILGGLMLVVAVRRRRAAGVPVAAEEAW